MPETIIKIVGTAFATISFGLGLLALAAYALETSTERVSSDLDQDPLPDIMELHPKHLGKLCEWCDELASHYDKGNKVYLCPDHEPRGLIEAFSIQIEWDLHAYLNAWRSQLLD
jgi:uncharacterized protein (DUF2249 family)